MLDFKGKTMKKIIAFLLLFSLNVIIAEKIILTNPVIEFIDGKTFGINGDVIGFMSSSKRIS